MCLTELINFSPASISVTHQCHGFDLHDFASSQQREFMHFVLQRSEVPHSWGPRNEGEEIEHVIPVPRKLQGISEIEIYADGDHGFVHYIWVLEINFRVFKRIAGKPNLDSKPKEKILMTVNTFKK